MVFQVAIGHNIVVSLGSVLDGFAATTFLLCWLGAFVRWLEMVLLHVDVADDVVIDDGVFALAEIPRLLLGVVWTVLQAFQLVLKIQNVVCLLHSQGFVLSSDNEAG